MRIITRVLKRATRSLRGLGPYLLLVAVLAGLIAIGLTSAAQRHDAQRTGLGEQAARAFCDDRPNVHDCRGDVVNTSDFGPDQALVTIHLHGTVDHPLYGPTPIHGPIMLLVRRSTGELLGEAYLPPQRED